MGYKKKKDKCPACKGAGCKQCNYLGYRKRYFEVKKKNATI